MLLFSLRRKMAKITLYSTPTCTYCAAAKDFFKENKIAYTNKDVTKDQKAHKEMLEKSGSNAVLVIDIDGKILVGFDEDELKSVLGMK